MQNREAFVQCLELRDSIQSVVGASHMLSEMGERISELDLSLAGVSDSTARHGKAVSTLADQQKTTSSTLDAVVRAVKRLAQSRSRGCSPGRLSAATSLTGREVATCEGARDGDPWESEPRDPHEVHDVHEETLRGHTAQYSGEDCRDEAADWCDNIPCVAAGGGLPSPRSCGGGYQVDADWKREWARGERRDRGWNGRAPTRHQRAGPTATLCSGSPANRPCSNSWAGSGWPDGSTSARRNTAPLYSLDFIEEPHYVQEECKKTPRGDPGPGGTGEMGNVVHGVLTRIEEALNKLDGPDEPPSTRNSEAGSLRSSTPKQTTPRRHPRVSNGPWPPPDGASRRQRSSGSGRSAASRRWP